MNLSLPRGTAQLVLYTSAVAQSCSEFSSQFTVLAFHAARRHEGPRKTLDNTLRVLTRKQRMFSLRLVQALDLRP